MEERNAVYVYAVARPFPRHRLGDARGVGGYPVYLVAQQNLAAAVSPIPVNSYDERGFRVHLGDIEWLEAAARAHHRVVDEISQNSAVIPLRMASVYNGEEQVRALLRDEGGAFESVLRRLSGRVEWGVKVLTRPPTAPGGATQRARRTPGRTYRDERRPPPESAEDRWRDAAALARRVDDLVGGLAEAREDHRPLLTRRTGTGGETAMHASYLVPADRTPQLVRIAERLRASAPRGTRIVVSGPWAPYSFAMTALGTADTRHMCPAATVRL
ncbi:GvpL/GvpF family gas vesicle protein [Nocardiopsis rhodophaea]|uniref:GvpL/GvpF family gas vesicle protein n=1 Tax=Nocardiopsis rhodophaea TaxID=280238 RepID=A0ABP5EY55_9ACTN